MKKTFRLFAFAAAAVAMLSSCAKETVVSNGEDTGKTFTVTAEYTEPNTDSKTAFVDGDNPYIKWLSTDQIRVYEFIDGTYNAYFNTKKDGTHLSADSKKATFDVELSGGDKQDVTSYCYTVVYPAASVEESNNFYYFEIPASQTLSEGHNFAEGSDVLIGKPVNMTSRISTTTNLEVQFKRPGTVVALTLKGITAGETISSVKVTAPTGQKIAGRCKVNMLTGEVPEADKAYYGGTNEITLNCGNVVATGNDVFYFRCIDGTWASGSEVSIAVETNAATYTKTVNLPNDYVFADGGLTRFGFQGMTREAKEGMPTYEKFTGALMEGDYIICSGTTAMSNEISSDRATYVTVTVEKDVIKTNSTAIVWHIAQSGESWTIYNTEVEKYAASTGVKNKMQLLEAGTDDKALWTASESETYEFVNKQNAASKVNANLRYNSGYGFACYSTSTGSALSLYKLVEAAPKSIIVSGSPTKTEYKAGDDFETAGLIATATYEDASEKDVTDVVEWTVTPSPLTAGTTSVSVVATYKKVSSTAYVVNGLTVTEAAELTSISIKTAPTKVEYIKGEKFDPTGLVISRNYSDKTSDDYAYADHESDFTFAPALTAVLATTDTKVTITYKGKTVDQAIIVKSIANTKETAYTVSEARALIDAGKDLDTEVYVKGKISEIVTAYSSSYGNISFNISANGSKEGDQFQFFRNFKGANKTKWTDADTKPAVGNEVIGFGKLTKYGSTYEFAEGNYIVSITEAPYLNASATKASGISADGEEITINVDTNIGSWEAVSSDDTNFKVGSKTATSIKVTVAKNTDTEKDRTATITVSAEGVDDVVITLTQSKAGQGGGTTKYVKVTSATDLTNGQYLIVYEAKARVFNGIDVINDYVETTITNNEIASTTEIDALTVTISSMTGGYSIKIDGGGKAGNYIYGKSGSNSIQYGNSAVANEITISNGLATILSNSTSLRYNATSGQDRFRYFKTTTTGSSYIFPALYKLTN